MEDIVLLEAVERYLAGEMSPDDKAFFEKMRSTNPEIDQLVVEHTYFLQGLDKYGQIRNFKHTLNEVENDLSAEGLFSPAPVKGKARIIQFWEKNKRNIAVAASIAIFTSTLFFGMFVSYSKKHDKENIQNLVDQIKQTNKKVNQLENHQLSINNVALKPEPPKVDFRATGFLIDGKGYLVTNAHVISRMKNIYVQNNKGDYFRANPVFTDNTVDLSILKIVDTNYSPINTLPYSIKKGNADLGEQFFTLGFPRNEIVYGEGYVSARSGSDGDTTSYQLTVSANPGNSGGPVINRNGEIIGIITAKDSKADGVVYAAKSKDIFALLDKMKKEDDKAVTIKTSSNTNLKGLDRVQQIKKMQEYVFMVVGN